MLIFVIVFSILALLITQPLNVVERTQEYIGNYAMPKYQCLIYEWIKQLRADRHSEKC